MKKCKIEGCDNPHKARGLCVMHYARFWRTKKFTRVLTKKFGRICCVKYCYKKHCAKGYCHKHYDKFCREAGRGKKYYKPIVVDWEKIKNIDVPMPEQFKVDCGTYQKMLLDNQPWR